MGFCSLQHIRIRRSTDSRVLPTRYVPPSGFGHPLDGLLPSNPCRSYFVPAALLGFPPSKRSPLERWQGVSTQPDPHAVPLSIALDAGSSRTAEPRLLGFDPPESPWPPNAMLTRPPLDAPLGFLPSRVFRQEPCSGFRPNSFPALGPTHPDGARRTRASKYPSTPAWHLPKTRTGRERRKVQPS
jgi:hypothetical protein